MAYNFFVDLPINKNFPTAMKRRFDVIISHMDEKYTLKRGQTSEIVEELKRRGVKRAGDAVVRVDIRIIKNVVRLLREGQDVRKELQNRSDRAAQAALVLFDRLPEEITWESIVEVVRDESMSDEQFGSDDESDWLQVASASDNALEELLKEINSKFHKLVQQVKMLQEQNVELKADLEIAQKAYQKLDEHRYQALRRLSFLESNGGDEEDPHEEVSEEGERQTAHAVYSLPRRAPKFGNTEITYERAFLRRFKELHPDIKRQCTKAIRELAMKGWKETTSSQQHKRAPSARSDVSVPKGAWVSRVSSKYRYVWSSVRNDLPTKYIIIHYVGPHDMWDSQK